MRWRLLCAAMLGVLLVGLGLPRAGITAESGPKPRTLVRLDGEVTAFAQDGDRVAWSRASAGCGERAVFVLRLSTGTRVGLPSKRGSRSCREFGDVYPAPTLALAGPRALWAAYTQSHQETDGYFITAAEDDPVERRACRFVLNGGSEDSYAPTLVTVGDGRTLAYTLEGSSLFGKICTGLWLVDQSGHARQITRQGSTLLAAGGARVAVATTVDVEGCLCGPASWSPDGGRVAVASSHSVRSVIYLADADGRSIRRFADGSSPDWSRVTKKIVFARQHGQNASDVVVMSPDGTGVRVLASGTNPRWSPDGSKISFSDSQPKIHVIDADGSHDRTLGAIAVTPPVWSPDGSRLAYGCSGGRLCVDDANGKEGHMLGKSMPAAAAFSWSPDGARIAYTANNLAAGGGIDIRVVGADGRDDRSLTDPQSAHDGSPAWSPDGRDIVFVRGSATSEDDGHPIDPRLWIMHADGTAQRKLTRAAMAEDLPAWSPDGKRIAFTRGSYGDVYVVRRDGSHPVRLTAMPARSTAELRNGRTGRLVATASATGRVVAVALSGSMLALLVDDSSGQRIEMIDPRSGASRGHIAVPPGAAPELSAAGTSVVYHVGKTVFLVDGARRRTRQLAVAASAPIGLSIEGRRVAWAENGREHGRIRAILLDRH
jgi:TolB protein